MAPASVSSSRFILPTPLPGLIPLLVSLAMLPGFTPPASAAVATSVVSAGNIPYSGISPGGVDMATGEIIIVCRPDLLIDGPMPVGYGRYYASMLAREGLASGHLGPNWLGSYDWNLSPSGTMVNVVTNRGQLIQFQQSPVGGWDLLSPTDEKYSLDFVGGMWRFTHPGLRLFFLFDGTSHLLTQILDEHGNSLSLTYAAGLLSQVSDGLGRMLSFSYDGTGHVTQVSDGTRSVGFGYTGGILTAATDVAGHTWMYAYQGPGPIQGLLTGVTEPLGNTPLTQAYDPSGRVMSQTDAAGGIANYAYDAPTGNVYMDPLGNPWTYLHDAQNRLISLMDPTGGATSYAYDTLGRPSSVVRPLGDMTSFSYDAASGYPSTLTRADGSAINWTYSFHTDGGFRSFDLATASYPDGTTENYGRDASGNLTNFIDRGGFPWGGTYNTRGQLLTATNPASGVTTFTYDPLGRVTTGKDNAGNTTQYAYDALSRLTQVTWPDLNVRHYAYDNLDALTGLTDERGKLWSHGYDANGRLTAATDPLLETTGFQYDALDRATQVTDPLGHGTMYGYDPNGRVMSVTDGSSRTTTFQYDGLNRLMGIADPAGGTDVFTYDADSRMISAQDPLGHTTGYGYDMLDRVIHVTDPVGTGFDYSYDLMGRLRTATGPLGYMESFNYDARGLLTSYFNSSSETDFSRTALGEVSQVTDPNRNVWPRSYDPQGRLISSADPLGRGTTYQYDGLSRVIHIGRSDGTVQQIDYDPAGRVTAESYTGGPALSYAYDDANRLTSATGASFTYDAAGRMTSSNGLGMTYDGAGRILSETLAPGKVVSYSYDSRGLLSQLTDWMGGSTTFAHDAAGRLSTMSRPPPNGIVTTYQYDAADRPTASVEARPPPQNTPLSSISITRDALGRATGIDRREPLMPGVTSPSANELSYDAASQLNGVSHDALGRMTADASRTFQWDAASRLAHYAAGADSPSFAYDAFGQVVNSTSGSQTVVQAWNYGHYPPTNDDTEVNLPSRSRLRIRTPSGMLLYTADGATGARTFYHYDEAGNTAYLTNDGGSVVAEYAYGPYGGVAGLGETADNPYTYGAGAGLMSLGSSGLWAGGGGVYDDRTMRMISGNTTSSGPVETKPGPIGSPGDWVTTKPGPIQSPGEGVMRQPGPIGSPGDWVALNPQPLPPGATVMQGPGPVNSPGSWVEKQPGPAQSPGSWVELNPQPFPPGPTGAVNPGPQLFSGPPRIFIALPSSGPASMPVGEVAGLSHTHVTKSSGMTEWPENDPGEAIDVDKYARIKVQFFWDREGKEDTNSSCWVRVGTVWGGKPGGGPGGMVSPYPDDRFATTRIKWIDAGDENPDETLSINFEEIMFRNVRETGGSGMSACTWCPQ